jgi:hypothetical protein
MAYAIEGFRIIHIFFHYWFYCVDVVQGRELLSEARLLTRLVFVQFLVILSKINFENTLYTFDIKLRGLYTFTGH